MEKSTYEKMCLLSKQELLTLQILQRLDSMTIADIGSLRKLLFCEEWRLSKKVKKFIVLVTKVAITRAAVKQ